MCAAPQSGPGIDTGGAGHGASIAKGYGATPKDHQHSSKVPRNVIVSLEASSSRQVQAVLIDTLVEDDCFGKVRHRGDWSDVKVQDLVVGIIKDHTRRLLDDEIAENDAACSNSQAIEASGAVIAPPADESKAVVDQHAEDTEDHAPRARFRAT